MNRDLANRLPAAIRDFTEGLLPVEISVGMSAAGVYRYGSGPEAMYLKVEQCNDVIRHEYRAMEWLQGVLPVPEILHWEEGSGCCWLLMSALPGGMACGDMENTPLKRETVEGLAAGIRMLRAVDIADCPLDMRLDVLLDRAAFNVEQGLVDMDNLEEGNSMTAGEMLARLRAERPGEELCLGHGDYCLPNVFLDGGTVTGFLDLGRTGVTDKWFDVALCARSIRHNGGGEDLVEHFFHCLGEEPDWKKMEYFILLDELF